MLNLLFLLPICPVNKNRTKLWSNMLLEYFSSNSVCIANPDGYILYPSSYGIFFISFINLIISDKCVHITIGTIVAGNKTYGK